jgi:hypothetical protein
LSFAKLVKAVRSFLSAHLPSRYRADAAVAATVAAVAVHDGDISQLHVDGSSRKESWLLTEYSEIVLSAQRNRGGSSYPGQSSGVTEQTYPETC